MPVFLVSRDNLAGLWPHAHPLIARAIGEIPTHSADDVRAMLDREACQMWVQWNGALEACAVTEFVEYPRGTWLRIWLMAAAPDARADNESFSNALDDYRAAHDARGFEAIGRLGFLRRFPEAKFEGAVMRITVT